MLLSTLSSPRANKAFVALRLFLMPLQRLMEFINDRLLESRTAGEIRVFFQPLIATPGEMSLIARKLEAAVQLLREVDPVNAAVFADTFHKVYITSQPYLHVTSSGAPRLPKMSLVSTSVPIVASFLVQYVPMARAGLIRATFQLIDPVPIMIAMRDVQIALLRAADPDSSDAQPHIRRLEGEIAVLRPQLKST